MGKKGLSIGKQAVPFTLPSASGRPVSLSDFRDQAVMLIFFRGTF